MSVLSFIPTLRRILNVTHQGLHTTLPVYISVRVLGGRTYFCYFSLAPLKLYVSFNTTKKKQTSMTDIFHLYDVPMNSLGQKPGGVLVTRKFLLQITPTDHTSIILLIEKLHSCCYLFTALNSGRSAISWWAIVFPVIVNFDLLRSYLYLRGWPW